MYVIKRQQHDATAWLVSLVPESWGELDHAMRFETRREAHLAANSSKVSGGWSIDPTGIPPIRAQT
jgi:hypothetical protein